MSPGPTFDRVYLALKEQLTGARFAPGDHLEPAAIGDQLSASITPVRDALHRLVGERLVETPRHDGFRVPSPSEAELRDLYAWNEALLLLALRRQRASDREVGKLTDRAASDRPATAADLFRAIARLTGSHEHEAAVEGMNERLGGLRCAEERLLGDTAQELARLRASLADRDLAGLRRGITDYHRRRRRLVGDLLVAARRAPNNR